MGLSQMFNGLPAQQGDELPELLWWSALSAGVAAGLLELGEWLAFLRAKAFQKATEQPAGVEEGPKT
jgi:hypothetical protein